MQAGAAILLALDGVASLHSHSCIWNSKSDEGNSLQTLCMSFDCAQQDKHVMMRLALHSPPRWCCWSLPALRWRCSRTEAPVTLGTPSGN